jgi:hypothetical protein
MRACVTACLDFDGDEKLCRASCTCTADALRRAGLLGRTRHDVGGADEARVAALARQCQKVP